MYESQLSSATSRKETLQDIWLRTRPNIGKLLPVFAQLDERSIVGISGRSGSGKSMLLMEIMAHILLRDERIEILLIDTERHFRLFKLIEICDKLSGDHSLIKCQLEKLHIIKTFHHLSVTALLEQNRNISMVVWDSLESYYNTKAYAALEAGGSLSKEYYMFTHLLKLSNLVKKFDVIVVYAKPESQNDHHSFRDNISTHFIELEKGKDSFSMKLRTNKGEEQRFYSIHQDGIKFSENLTKLTIPIEQ